MRKASELMLGVAVLLSAAQWSSADDVDIAFMLTNLGGNRWQYTYDVTNNALVVNVDEFTIWFELGSYGNLLVTTPDPPSSIWDEIVVQPDTTFGLDGFYDALVETGGTGIAPGQNVPGFSVAFDWLGTGTPDPQAFDIVDPITFQTVFSGTTTPEPAGLCLLAAPLLFLRRRS
jgi:hypothetical protein